MPDATSLRHFVYDRITVTGRPPSLSDIAGTFRTSTAGAAAAIGSLNIGKAILAHPESGEIWMAGPFSADPTPYKVRCEGVAYYANCAWDMLGIPALLRQAAVIDTVCTDCGAPMGMTVDPERGPSVEGVVNFLLPARRWYDNIGFT
jgi:hypothetical protein